MAPITYESLFEYLTRLGFADSSPSEFARVFQHSEQSILLAFSMLDNAAVDRAVRNADMTSVELRLQQHGLLTGPLANAVQQVSGIRRREH